MNREEIEKLIAETAKKERNKNNFNVEKVRALLNIIFIICAVIGIIVYFAYPEQRLIGMGTIGVGMIFKVVEFFLRFLF
ncbi:MAG: hypothetical protein J6Q57_04595 [Paraprevotella sp.]|jgi:hypothetical protein|nr:hypothetical protein [Paraprevotella sp.]